MTLWGAGSRYKRQKKHNKRCSRTKAFGFSFLIASAAVIQACDSTAQVQWENQSRTAMGNKLGSSVGNPEISTQYKLITASLSESERELVNALLETILAKDPELLDISATIESALESISSITQQSELRAKLESILQLQIQIAGVADTSLRASFVGFDAASNDKKIDYLTSSLSLHEFASKNADLKKYTDEYFPKITAGNLATSTLVWIALSASDETKVDQMKTILRTALFAEESSFAIIGEKLAKPENQAPLLALVAKLKSDDANSQLFLTAFGSNDSGVYPSFDPIIDEYNKAESSLAVKTAIKSVIAKISVIDEKLKNDFVKTIEETIKQSDAVVRLNRINASTDTLQGNGFFDDARYTNKYITNKEALVCGVQGSGIDGVTYSFKWTDGGALTIFDWTIPSNSKTNTSKTFNIGETAQCFARIFIGGIQAAELQADKVTVKSAPPEFESGDPPAVTEVEIFKGEKVVHTAELAEDPNADDFVLYRLIKKGDRGNTIQTSLTTFEYTPNPSYVGNDEFSYVACDQNGLCSAAKVVKVTVKPANVRPSINGIAAAYADYNTKTITLTEDETPTTPVTLILEDDELGSVNCSTVVTVTSNDTSIIENNALAIEIAGVFPVCTFKLTPKANAFGQTTVIVSVTDGVDPTPATDTFTVVVNNVNDAPTFSLSGSVAVTPEDTNTTPIALTINDPDGPTGVCNSSFVTYTSSNTSLVSGTGGMLVSGTWPNCSIAFVPQPNQSGTSTISLNVTDGLLFSTPQSFSVTFVPVNDAPSITAGATLDYDEGDSAAAIDTTINITDTDDINIDTATVQITVGLTSGDFLEFTDTANITASAYNSATGTITLTSTNATKADFIAALKTVRFYSTSHDPTQLLVDPTSPVTARTISWTVNDGTISSAAATSTINITASNDAPVIAVGSTPISYQENTGATVINATVTLGDDDDTSLEGATVSLSNFTTGDTLTFSPMTGNPVSVASNTGGVLTLTGTATVAQYEAALESITFNSNSENPTQTAVSRTVSWQVNDGNVNSNIATSLILISPLNDAPTGTVTCSTLAAGDVYITGTANGSGWTLDTCSGATDPEGDTLTYKLDYIATGGTSSASYPCPDPISSVASGTSISGSFPTGLGVFGSCQYKLKACDTSGSCTTQSTNSVIISSYQINASTPATPTLSAACVIESSSTINVTGNLSSVTWQATTSAPSAANQSASVSSFPATANFSTDITAVLLGAEFLPTPPTKTTATTAASAAIEITQGTLAAAIGNPPTAQVTSATSTSALYTITRALETLLMRSGDAQGAADTYEEVHIDGQQPQYVTTAGCRTCNTGPIASISSGESHSCVIESNGSTKCWGNNSSGRLGMGSNSGQFEMPQTVNTTNIAATTHVQISAGSNFTCLLGTSAQGVTCWGDNASDQLGFTGVASANAPTATTVTGLTNPIAVSASKTGEHACAITTGGSAFCWGDNTSSQLGDNTTTQSASAIEVKTSASTTLTRVRSIAAGEQHSCATVSFDTTANEGIYCWGKNDQGQLGDGSMTIQGYATPVDETNSGLTSANTWFAQVVAGKSHSCALRNDGAVFCWGDNSSGQLGDSTTTDRALPTAVNGLGSGSGVVSLSAGSEHTCALKNDHTIVCWGKNDKGQLGDSSTTNSSVPVTAINAATSTAVAISAGGSHTCAASFDGTVRCWGWGELGQLGNNTVAASADGAADDCDPATGFTSYCSKTPALVNWTSGVTSNATLRPKTCHKFAIP